MHRNELRAARFVLLSALEVSSGRAKSCQVFFPVLFKVFWSAILTTWRIKVCKEVDAKGRFAPEQLYTKNLKLVTSPAVA